MTRGSTTPRCHAARELALRLMAEFGLIEKGWVFRFNNARRTAGMCKWPFGGVEGRIELSVHFVERNSEEEVLDSILHEIAHALSTPGSGHGEEWVENAKKVGARPVRCFGREVIIPIGKYQATCPNCHVTHSRHRKPLTGRAYHCIKCGPLFGRLAWSLYA